jgi:hypothetical protein
MCIRDRAKFTKHRKTLVSEGRIAEPKAKGSVKRTVLQCLKMTSDERALYRKQLATKPDDYVPPTLDTVPTKWLDNRTVENFKESNRKTRKGKTTNDSFSVQRYSNKSDKAGRSKAARKG